MYATAEKNSRIPNEPKKWQINEDNAKTSEKAEADRLLGKRAAEQHCDSRS